MRTSYFLNDTTQDEADEEQRVSLETNHMRDEKRTTTIGEQPSNPMRTWARLELCA